MNQNKNTQLPGDTKLPSSPAELSKWISHDKGNDKYTVEDFFRTPQKTQFKLSPDGNYYSYLAPHKGRKNIFVQTIDSKDAIAITHETERDLEDYMWANDNRLLYIKDKGGDENYKLLAVDKDGKNAKDLIPDENVKIQIIDPLIDNEEELIIGMNKNNPQLFEPYRLDINTGDLQQLAKNDNITEPITAWLTDHQGNIRLAQKVVNGIEEVLMYRKDEDSPFEEVIKTDFREGLVPLFFDFKKPNLIYVTSNLGRDKSVITQFDLSKGEEYGEVLFGHEEVDVTGLSYSKKRKVLTAVNYTTDRRHQYFLDEYRENLQEVLESKLGDYEIIVTSSNRKEDKFMVRTYSDRSLGAYYFYDAHTEELKKLSDVSPWIKEEDMSPMTPIKYNSSDGLTLNGYLTLPKGQEAKNLPLVVIPHGGPWARDTWGFHPSIQLMASRAYAVLQVNFRGSTGYGRSFWEKSFKQWGQTMQQDITDGVHYLIEKGIADKDKIAIFGGSYGGYAVLAGITYTPDLYKCAIDYVGVSNLLTFMNTIPPYWRPYLEMMYTMVGHPEHDKEMMEAFSPALHTDKISTPLLVVQGANDPRVNIDESDQIVRSLRARGIEVPYLVKYNEGHGFHNEENIFELYKVIMGFLGYYLS